MDEDEAYVILEQVKAFLDNYVDVVDGPEGTQRPNKAMQLTQSLDEVFTWLEKF